MSSLNDIEPKRETRRALAEADRDLEDLKGRLEATMAEIEEAKEAALNANDLEKARELEGSLVAVEETLGLIRYHPYTSARGGSNLIGNLPPTGGRPSQKGSRRDSAGGLKKGVTLKYRVNKGSARTVAQETR